MDFQFTGITNVYQFGRHRFYSSLDKSVACSFSTQNSQLLSNKLPIYWLN